MDSAVLQNGKATRPPQRWKADTSLAVAALIWGTTFVVVKSALLHISPTYFLALRFLFAGVSMLLLFIPAFRRAGWRRVLAGLRGGATAGIFLWLGYSFQTYGLRYTTASKSGFLTGLYIVLVPILGGLLYKRVPQISEWIGVFVATAGLVLLTLPALDLHAGIQMNRGDGLTIGCAVAFAFHVLTLGYYSQREQFEAVAVGQILATGAFSAIALLVEPPRAHWSGNLVAALVVTGLFATVLTFALQTWAQKYTSATRTALIFALEPVFALLTAVLFGGESLTTPGLAGAALILGGILLVELKPFVRA